MQIEKFDSSLNDETFKSKVNNIFVLLLSSVMNKDIERVDHFISDDVFNKYKVMIEYLKDKNYIQMYEQLNVKSTEIKNIEKLEDKIVVTVHLVSRALEYIMDSEKNIVTGNDNTRLEKEYILTLEKSINVKKQSIARKCPSCGANMDVNYSGECQYCGTIYNNEDFDYILTNIKTV